MFTTAWICWKSCPPTGPVRRSACWPRASTTPACASPRWWPSLAWTPRRSALGGGRCARAIGTGWPACWPVVGGGASSPRPWKVTCAIAGRCCGRKACGTIGGVCARNWSGRSGSRWRGNFAPTVAPVARRRTVWLDRQARGGAGGDRRRSRPAPHGDQPGPRSRVAGSARPGRNERIAHPGHAAAALGVHSVGATAGHRRGDSAAHAHARSAADRRRTHGRSHR